jgi:hypothetical protein
MVLGSVPTTANAWSSSVYSFYGLKKNGGVPSQSQYQNTNSLNVTVRSTYYTRNGRYESNRINVTLYMWTSGGYRYYSQQSVDANGGGTVYWNAPTGWYYVQVDLANAPNNGSYASGSFYMWGK